ncbi:pyridoxal-phosphate dependent enzyme [Flavobacterium sp. HJSW_4]|uniref:pyridoxal-phosphate dependent enzyme n=1 Tax=Flavobacterium sp. HJSW_4 TaxID=3344660 RepID=UPI0035F27565
MNLFSAASKAQRQLKGFTVETPLETCRYLSEKYNAEICLKREDMQLTHSFKLRGAYSKISTLSPTEKKNGIIASSACSHLQGVAHCCNALRVKGTIYVPTKTSVSEIEKIKSLGKEFVKVIRAGESQEHALAIAMGDSSLNRKAFVHPFDDLQIIAGQASTGLEILEQTNAPIDFLFVPMLGGGLAAGIVAVFKVLSPNTKIIAVLPEEVKNLKSDPDKKTLNFTGLEGATSPLYHQLIENLHDRVYIPQGHLCTSVLELHKHHKITLKVSGALSISALDLYADQLEGKNVVCILSEGLNKLKKQDKLKELSRLFLGLVHYLRIEFPNGIKGAKHFINNILAEDDAVTFFYTVKSKSCSTESIIFRLETKNAENIFAIKKALNESSLKYNVLKKIKYIRTVA